MDEVKAWRCEGGHVMGQVVRDGGGVRRLVLYREAVGPHPPAPSPNQEHDQERGRGEVDVIAVVEGYVADVVCSRCGRVRSWFPDERAVRRMMRRMETG